MMRKLCFVSAVSAIALAAACSKHSGTPTSPSSTVVARPGASADTNNLKVSPPTPVAPADEQPKGLQLKLIPIYGVTIPVIVRLGNLDAKAAILSLIHI